MNRPCRHRVNGPSVAVSIGESGYTRIKGNGNRFAIGDSRGKPITGYDFIYVSKSPCDDASGGVEVVTGHGVRRIFGFADHVLSECAGASGGTGVGTVGAGDASGADGGVGGDAEGGSHAPPGAIDYGDVKDEITTPVLGRVPLLWGGPAGRNSKRRKHGVLALPSMRGKRRRTSRVSRRS